MTVTFVHTSDLQIGMKRGFLGEDQALFDDSRLRAVTRLGELAAQHGAEFIVVAGDVFEANSLSRQVTGRALDVLKALPVPVYLLPGNHDPLVADSIFRKTEGLDNVHVLDTTEPVAVRDGVEIVGAPWLTKMPAGDLVFNALQPLEPTDAIRIMIAHGQVDAYGNDAGPGLIDLDYVRSRLGDGTIDYLALGDTHSTTRLDERVYFSGSPETTDYHERTGDDQGGESDSGNALLVSVDKKDIEVQKLKVGEWTFDALHAQLDSREDVDRFLARLDAYPDKARTCVKYALTGTLDLTSMEALSVGLDDRAPVFTALYERTRLTELYLEPGDDELETLTLGGVGNAALTELLSDVDDDVARDAVNLLFRLSKEVAK